MLRRWFGSGSGRITRHEADLLFDAEPGALRGSGLPDLLAAAAAPARPDELAGERAAVAGFRREFRAAAPAAATGPAASAAATGAAAPGRDSLTAGGSRGSGDARAVRRRRRRVGTVAALSAAVLAVGGTAYAASTDRLPDSVQRVVDGMFAGGTPSGSEPDGTRTGGPGGASPIATGRGTGAAPGASAGTNGTPGVSEGRLNGLCRSWEATRGNPHANAISDEDLRVLAEAAGGADRIEAFCAGLRNGAADPSKPGKPGNPDPGGGHPTAPPGGGPTKKGKSR